MKKIVSTSFRVFTVFFCVFIFCLAQGCDDFVAVDAPRIDLTRSTVFKSDATAKAAMNDIYYNMHSTEFASGDPRSLSYLGSISSDEQVDYTTGGLGLVTQPFYHHTLTPTDQAITGSWSQLYSWIYKSNAVLEGLAGSTGISEKVTLQLKGESKFIRAFAHFYLVNLWGPVPVITSTDYERNRNVARQSESEVYAQIIADLIEAQSLLADDYSASANERTKPNKWVVTAFLARTYLYSDDWKNAELQSSSVISNADRYSLQSDLKNVFAKNNPEAIWQFKPTSINLPQDRLTFTIAGTTPSLGALRNELVDAFIAGDKRRENWVSSVADVNGQTYHFATKYGSSTQLAEYSTVLRLAEQYLIRAEARIHLGNFEGARQDINIIRERAGLGAITANDAESLLLANYNERRLEYFTEWGHRWLDLKRSGKIGEVLGPLKPKWRSEASQFPIPESQILNSPVTQNSGY
jgi:hypothetical protein